MKNYDITLRLPFSNTRLEAVEVAAEKLPGKCSIRKSGLEIHVDAKAPGYDMDGAYRYMWKELAIALASRKKSQNELADDEWRDMAVDHMMQLRAMVEQFAELYPAAEGVMKRYGIWDPDIQDQPVLLSLRALQEKAHEFLVQLNSKEPAPS